MADPIPEIVSTIQSASIKRHPSPHHDINPSTAASRKEPVIFPSPPDSPVSGASIHSSALDAPQPAPRKANLPPLPDLRFEQSYLASLKDTKNNWEIAYITVRDQVFMPLAQGMLWSLALSGWRHWNQNTAIQGGGLGAKVRRWWWRFNDWELPGEKTNSTKDKALAEDVAHVSLEDASSFRILTDFLVPVLQRKIASSWR